MVYAQFLCSFHTFFKFLNLSVKVLYFVQFPQKVEWIFYIYFPAMVRTIGKKKLFL